MAWANEPSITTADESSIISSTSSLQYVNSQLVAHGFAHNPGLSLDGLSNTDTERVVKCLLALLGQRIQDMERTDDLNTKTRTMGYDNDRLKSMHQVALDRASNAEREMNLWKSRASAAEKASQGSEKRYKALAAENQRLRTTLQSVRAGSQTEIKKFEKEKDKLLERLGRLADSKPSAHFMFTDLSGLDVAESNLGGGKGYMDIALEDAENARSRLAAECDDLRKLVVDCTNSLQTVVHSAHTREDDHAMEDEPTPVTLNMLFPLEPQNAAREKLNSILNTLRVFIDSRPKLSESSKQRYTDTESMDKLQQLVDSLRSELDQARSYTSTYASQAQTLFDRFVEDKRPHTGMSVDLTAAPARNEVHDHLRAQRTELDKDRYDITEAAVKLGKERAALEVQRLQLLEEKRGWEVQKVLFDLPPTPKLASSSGRKSVRRDAVRKAMSPGRRKPRSSLHHLVSKISMSKRVSFSSPGKRPSSKVRSKMASQSHTLETELISMPPPSPPPPSREEIAMMTSTEELLASCSSAKQLVLPTEFVLPPPSPQASLPVLPKSAVLISPSTKFSFAIPSAVSSISLNPFPAMVAASAPISASPTIPNPFPQSLTPRNQQFSIAKRAWHPYSPAKPSPLSRILMMAEDDSFPPPELDDDDVSFGAKPAQLDYGMPLPAKKATLGALAEDNVNLASESRGASGSGSMSDRQALTLEEELGIAMDAGRDGQRRRRAPLKGKMRMEDVEDVPLKEKNASARRSPPPRKAGPPSRRPVTVACTQSRPGSTSTARDKGKRKEVEKPKTTSVAGIGRTRTATVAGLDKENGAAKRMKPSPPSLKSSVEAKKRPNVGSRTTGASSRTAPSGRVAGGRSATGPRRVPVVGAKR